MLAAIIGALVVAVAVLVTVAVLQMAGKSGSSESAAGAGDSPSQTSQPIEPTDTAQTPDTEVVTVTAPPQTTTEPPPAPFPPDGATVCPGSSSVAVNGNTSCEFAANVTEGFRQHGLGVVTAYSPVTGIWYDMTCSQAGVKLVQCTGGNNAAVYIRE